MLLVVLNNQSSLQNLEEFVPKIISHIHGTYLRIQGTFIFLGSHVQYIKINIWLNRKY